MAKVVSIGGGPLVREKGDAAAILDQVAGALSDFEGKPSAIVFVILSEEYEGEAGWYMPDTMKPNAVVYTAVGQLIAHATADVLGHGT